MGCDIHIYAEVKENGEWEKVGPVFDDPYYAPERPLSDWNQPKIDQPYVGRNYDLFAILADVRNGRGFAGVPTGTGFVPIAAPRGLPNDVTPGVEAQADSWGRDGHSHSWLLLSELQGYDWDQVTTHVSYYTSVQWESTYRDSVGEHFFKTITALQALGHPDSVRIVFWFDN